MLKHFLTFDTSNGYRTNVLKAAGLALLLCGVPQAGFAVSNNALGVEVTQQSGTVRGTVVDETGEPLIGVSVVEKGTTNGTATDIDGNFSLQVAQGKTLEVSYIGYISQTIVVKGSEIKVVLKEDLQNLEEVVVVGFGTQKKANLTGAVANVDNKLLDNRPLTNLSSGLAGLLPGVQVTQGSGQPGADAGAISVRGVGSFNNSSPMVIIDGIEGNLDDVNPNDVESISVLKDAASSAIYGSKAANGVILVTTKRGKSGQTTVSYSGLVGVTSATNTPEYMSSGEIAEKWNAVRAYEGVYADPMFTAEQVRKYKDGSDPDNYPNTDWLGLLYKNSIQTSHNVTLSGGSETARYMASVGYLYQDGIVKNYDKNQYSGRINVDINPSKKLETSWGLAYLRADVSEPLPSYNQNAAPGGGFSGTNSVYQIFRQIIRISPMVTNQYADGSYGSISDGNPIYWVESDARGKTTTTNLTAQGSVKYYFLPSLSLKGIFAYNEHNNQYLQHAIQAKYRSGVQGETFASVSMNNYYRLTFDLTPEWKQSFGSHNFDVLAGYHAEMFKNRYTYAYRKGMANDALTDIDAGSSATAKASGNTRELAMISWFGRVNYDYAGKYLVELDTRYDGSSRFADGHRWGFFPSVSAGWRISEEDFFDAMKDKINNLKLRASWGNLGNQDIYSYYPTVSTMSLGYGYTLGGNYVAGARTVNAVNPLLQWEKTTTWGIGLDAAMGKFTANLDYYNKKTTGILMTVEVPRTFALSNYYDNVGAIRNSGVELALTYNNRWSNGLNLEVGANVAYNQSKVLDVGDRPYYDPGYDQYTVRNYVGGRVGAFYGYLTDGIFQSQAEIDSWPKYETSPQTRRPGDMKYVDVNGDGVVNADDRVSIGSQDPSWTFGFHVSAAWKGFDLIAFFQGAAGVNRYIADALGGLNTTDSKPLSIWRDSWTTENTGAKYPRMTETDSPGNTWTSDFWIQDASYLRMKELQIGYTLPKNILSNIGIANARVYLSGQNLFTITSMLKGFDPETSSGRGNEYPTTRVTSLGVNLTF